MKKWKRDLVNELMGFSYGSTVLDIGCSDGLLADIISDRVGYTGVDYNQSQIDFCKSKGLIAHVVDLKEGKLPLKDSAYDLVVLSHVLEHLQSYEQQNLMKEVCRVLKPGGRVLIFAPTPYHWYFYDDWTHQRPCTHGQLIDLCASVKITPLESKYSLFRWCNDSFQKWCRLPPLRFLIWEVFFVGVKYEDKL